MSKFLCTCGADKGYRVFMTKSGNPWTARVWTTISDLRFSFEKGRMSYFLYFPASTHGLEVRKPDGETIGLALFMEEQGIV